MQRPQHNNIDQFVMVSGGGVDVVVDFVGMGGCQKRFRVSVKTVQESGGAAMQAEKAGAVDVSLTTRRHSASLGGVVCNFALRTYSMCITPHCCHLLHALHSTLYSIPTPK